MISHCHQGVNSEIESERYGGNGDISRKRWGQGKTTQKQLDNRNSRKMINFVQKHLLWETET